MTPNTNKSCRKGCGRSRFPGRATCAVCLEKQRTDNRRAYKVRIERGQCTFCSASSTVGVFCFDHWFKNVGTPHGLGSKKGIALLKNLWDEQRGRCAVTGQKLTPGSNASLDHIIPKSRGGGCEKTNLRWVLLRVNQIKWDMTHDEFVEVCRLVVRTQEQRVGQAIAPDLSMRSN